MSKYEIGNSFIKFSVSDMDDSEIVIDNVFVNKSERGQGIGKSLVRKVIDKATEDGFKTIGLYCEPQTDDGLEIDALIEFYQSLHFVSDKDDVQAMTYSI
jgi:predicted GNAT family acetyltransferase